MIIVGLTGGIGSGKTIGITRVHMEEDPAALTHPAGMEKSSIS